MGTVLGKRDNYIQLSRRNKAYNLHTNAVEALNGVIRIGSYESALKMVWIAAYQASKKWTKPISNCSGLNHFYVKYSDMFPKVA